MCVYVCPETTAGIRLRSQTSRQAQKPRSQNFFPFLNFEKGKKYCERAVVAGATHNPVALGLMTLVALTPRAYNFFGRECFKSRTQSSQASTCWSAGDRQNAPVIVSSPELCSFLQFFISYR